MCMQNASTLDPIDEEVQSAAATSREKDTSKKPAAPAKAAPKAKQQPKWH